MNINRFRIINIICFLIFISNVAFGSELKKNEAVRVLAFCKAADELQEAYLKALLSQEKDVDLAIKALDNSDDNYVFPSDRISLSSHYGTSRDFILDLERSYELRGEGLAVQAEIVSNISTCKREISRLQVFVKAFAQYVNSERHLNDIQQSERNVIVSKITEEIGDLKNSLRTTQELILKTELGAENVMIGNHQLQNLLMVMFDDLQFMRNVVSVAEIERIDNDEISKIKIRRKRIANELVQEMQHVDFNMTDNEEKNITRDYYLMYQKLLSNVQVMLETSSLHPDDKIVRVYQNRIALEKLESLYHTLSR